MSAEPAEPLAERVALHPFLVGMKRSQLALLTDCAMAAHFQPGQIILQEGDHANRFYLIESGQVTLESRAIHGQPLIIDTIGPGGLLGWSWMFPPYTWHFTARATAADRGHLFLWHDPARVLRERSLVRLRTFQTHEHSHDQAFAICARKDARSSGQNRVSQAGGAGVDLHRSSGRQAGNRLSGQGGRKTRLSLSAGAETMTCGCFSMSDNSSIELRAQANKELVETLRRSKLFRDYERVFTEATGLPLALRPVVYWQLAHQGRKNENVFCALLAENPKTLAVCLQAHEEMVKHTAHRPHSVTCPYGLTETAVPVKLGDETIGYLRVGQVLRRAPRENDLTNVSQLLKRLGVPFSAKLRGAWQKNPFLPASRYNAIVRLLTFFAEQLSGLSNQLMLEKQNAEPALVSRAREYIERHKTEALSLANVASAAGASVFHFCKVFTKAPD